MDEKPPYQLRNMPFIQQIGFQGLSVFKISGNVRNWYNDCPRTGQPFTKGFNYEK